MPFIVQYGVFASPLGVNQGCGLRTYPAGRLFLSSPGALSPMLSQTLNRHSKFRRSDVSIRAGQVAHSRFPPQSGRVLAARVRMSWTAR